MEKDRSEATGKRESLWWGYGVIGESGVGVKEVSQGQVTGRLAINRLRRPLGNQFQYEGDSVFGSHFIRH